MTQQCPELAVRNAVMQPLLRPAVAAESMAPRSWSVTLFRNGFRLNDHRFTTLPQAREVIANWRRDCNEVRPHGSCGRIPPTQSATNYRKEQEAKANIHNNNGDAPVQQCSVHGLPAYPRYGKWRQVTHHVRTPPMLTNNIRPQIHVDAQNPA